MANKKSENDDARKDAKRTTMKTRKGGRVVEPGKASSTKEETK